MNYDLVRYPDTRGIALPVLDMRRLKRMRVENNSDLLYCLQPSGN